MSDVTQGNDQSARTETGEIKDQQKAQSVTSGDTSTKTESGSAKTDTTQESKSTNTKSADGTKTESKTDTKTDDKAAKGPPEKYEFKVPDGYEIDSKVLDEATPVFKELGLNQDQAQKLFDIYSKHSIEAAEAAVNQYNETRQGWRNEVIKDPNLGDGKEGLKPETRAAINKAISAIGDEKSISAFKEAMDHTGVGDNPAFVRAIAAWGKLLSEGSLVKGAGPAPTGQAAPGAGPKSAAAALYPNLPTSSQA